MDIFQAHSVNLDAVQTILQYFYRCLGAFGWKGKGSNIHTRESRHRYQAIRGQDKNILVTERRKQNVTY